MTRALAMAASLACLLSCERERRRFDEPPPSSFARTAVGRTDPQKGPFDQNAWAVSEGRRLYVWFNCAGCHAQGGGAIGPPLLDGAWVYGGEPDQIFSSITGGRPNGMPAFANRIPDTQIWQIVSYVRSLSGLLPLDVPAARNDTLSAKRPDNLKAKEAPHQEVRP
jgi:cytochrome c oxidase cbb3-type subunit III